MRHLHLLIAAALVATGASGGFLAARFLAGDGVDGTQTGANSGSGSPEPQIAYWVAPMAITSFTPLVEVDRLRNEVRERDSHWVQGLVTPEMRAYRNGHLAAMILLTGKTGVGKASLAGKLEESLFRQNLKSYLLDGRNLQWGLSADMDRETYFSGGEALRRFGEVAKLFVDAGHVVISTTNIFNQEDHSNITLLVEPSPVIEVQITDDTFPKGKPEIVLTVAEAEDHDKAIKKIIDYLKEQKILLGQNYSI